MIGRLLFLLRGLLLIVAGIVRFVATATVVPMLMILAGLLLGLIGLIEWILTGRQRVWTAFCKLDDAMHDVMPDFL